LIRNNKTNSLSSKKKEKTKRDPIVSLSL